MEIITNEKREDIEALMAENLKGSEVMNKTRMKILITSSFMFISGLFFIIFFTVQGVNILNEPVMLAISAVIIGYPIYTVFKFFIFYGNFRRKISSNTMKGKNVESYLGKNHIMIDEVGVHRSNKFREEHFFWNGIQKVTDAKEHIFIFDTDISAMIVPKRNFKSKEQITEFLEKIKEYRGI